MLVLALFVMGCDAEMGEQRTSGSSSGSAPTTDAGGDSLTSSGTTGDTGTTDDSSATDDAGTSDDAGSTAGAAIADGEVALTPDNTDVVFIGTHADPAKPDPRTCEFTDFDGTATVEDGALTAVSVTIQTEGITTFNPMLTDHLRNPDFFNALEYPEAKFESTSIEAGEDGTVTITGDLTLLAETKPVTFPATVSTEDGLTLNAEFTIDRTEWGMTARQDGVLKEVELQIIIGG